MEKAICLFRIVNIELKYVCFTLRGNHELELSPSTGVTQERFVFLSFTFVLNTLQLINDITDNDQYIFL